MIPDGSSDSRAVPELENHVTVLNGRVVLGEVKTLSTQSEKVQARANRIDPDIDKAAAELDAKYPGSTVLQEKKKYGKDGKLPVRWETSLPMFLLWSSSSQVSRPSMLSSGAPQAVSNYLACTADF